MSDPVETALAALQSRGVSGPVETAILLSGSAGSPVDAMTRTASANYADIPGFPQGIAGGRIVVGGFEGARVAVLEGRASFHDSGDAGAMRLPMQIIAKMGARLFVTAANGAALQADTYPGSVTVVSDHINFCCCDPLVGVFSDTRFVSMKDAYDPRLRRRFKTVGSASGVMVNEGVFLAVSGPSLETAAEARMAKALGAEVMGTGIVAEVILARWLGLRVAALAVVANFAAGIGDPKSGQGPKDGAMAGSIGLRRLLRAFLRPTED